MHACKRAAGIQADLPGALSPKTGLRAGYPAGPSNSDTSKSRCRMTAWRGQQQQATGFKQQKHNQMCPERRLTLSSDTLTPKTSVTQPIPTTIMMQTEEQKPGRARHVHIVADTNVPDTNVHSAIHEPTVATCGCHSLMQIEYALHGTCSKCRTAG